ncbi:hypothetical protein [Bacillus sp. 03113]|uniref:hypothetical protein n=1 Tax=Bacillus sp. 03113 TaxID=2578211 RepID=UPI001144EEB5|nr:hypothetical protein [Bacillus sp. 03113]
MAIEKFIRTMGFIALIGGIIRIGMTPSSLIWGGDSDPELLCAFIANIFYTVGTFGIFLALIDKIGKFGYFTFLVVTLSHILVTCTVWSTMLGTSPWEWGIIKSLEIGSGLLGMILFPIVILRAKVFPAWPSIILLIMLPVGFVPFMGSWVATLWGVGYAALGFFTWKGKTASKTIAKSDVKFSS